MLCTLCPVLRGDLSDGSMPSFPFPVPCKPGTYLKDEYTCESCAPGTHQLLQEQTSCTPCPLGSYSETGWEYCFGKAQQFHSSVFISPRTSFSPRSRAVQWWGWWGGVGWGGVPPNKHTKYIRTTGKPLLGLTTRVLWNFLSGRHKDWADSQFLNIHFLGMLFSACDDGWYGENCQNQCDCQNGACDKKTGECHCDLGWEGPRCAVGTFLHPVSGPRQLRVQRQMTDTSDCRCKKSGD